MCGKLSIRWLVGTLYDSKRACVYYDSHFLRGVYLFTYSPDVKQVIPCRFFHVTVSVYEKKNSLADPGWRHVLLSPHACEAKYFQSDDVLYKNIWPK